MNKKANFLLVASFLIILVHFANGQPGQPSLNQYCNYIASSNQRFGAQYQQDLSTQRCSFCQFSELSSANNFAQGCVSCPDYTTGTCNNCKPNFVQTPNKFCIPCPQGTTCCLGNNPSQDPQFQAAISQADNSQSGLQTIYNAFQSYSALRMMSCLPGYFALGHTCKANINNCANVVVKKNYFYCSQCNTGFHFDKQNNCVQDCTKISIQYVFQDNTSQISTCKSCTSASTCLTCNSIQYLNVVRYFTLDYSGSSKTLSIDDPTGKTLQSYQICRECPLNCINCNGDSTQCQVCAPYYVLKGGQCIACTVPSNYVQLNSDIRDYSYYYSGCTSTDGSISSYIWQSQISQGSLDTLGVAITRPIIKISSSVYTACDANCVSCQASQNQKGTTCTQCANGFYLDQTNANSPTCLQCPDNNSVLCVWNAKIKMPQITACKANPNDYPPYSLTYYLQLDFNAMNFNSNPQNYQPSQQCQLNKNNCKAMVNNDLNKIGLCSSCYSASDFAAGSGLLKTNYILVSGVCKICQQSGTKDCIANQKGDDVIPQTCQNGFQPTPINNTCKKCPDNCKTCNDNGMCTACDNSTYFSLLDTNGATKDCILPYKQKQISELDGCSNWGSAQQIPDYPSCQSCQTGYVLIKDAQIVTSSAVINAALCMSCPQNCSQCQPGNQRSVCTACKPGYYLSNNTCLQIPLGCATFNGTYCTICQYNYRLVDNKFCSLCYRGFDVANPQDPLSMNSFFDCPQAQCYDINLNQSTTTSSSYSNILSVITAACLISLILII
ncbi:transmembrane protein, putative (macronuclear) [Tetrahymena thermophila SB210]|uniref:Transmembrane protein, putative n=1 Tax=Tetrahymena thermophila (strain SB210) TaxID=312017 RepID=Q23QC1_TETTS|nr:transmembrane protein, putative [Tetrahymena thermophila SB210]EAR98663.1 transmembrane protein, putative [Tetrahymena thermophila SB210]|eukprot:XP_001018908.1 transmembrane protein, putative [Tetrahymena thermophila SB210]